MRRTRKLPPAPVSYLETHHAYTCPPLPEKGGLPTIIVTPADASTMSEFEIHFYSPKPVQQTFQPGFLPRMRSFFRRSAPPPSTQTLLEKAEYFDNEDDITESRQDDSNVPRIIVTSGEYRAVSQHDDDEEDRVDDEPIPGVPTISEEQWSTIRTSPSEHGTGPIALPLDLNMHQLQHHRLLTRRVRALLFLSVPVALVAFHLITHQMGIFRPENSAGFWADQPMEATPIGGPSL